MGHDVRFSEVTSCSDRIHHVVEADVRILLSRLPSEVCNRLRAVHFNDRSHGARRLGYVSNRGRREIALCALPPRMSLTRFLVRGQSPEQFGAKRGGQWPALAIRRFLLYDVFLHELGHLQIVDEEAKSVRRKFADETKAQEFAMNWCKFLWSAPFDHPNPVHNPPSPEELTDEDLELSDLLRRIQQDPNDAELYQELGKSYRIRGKMEEAKVAYEKSLALNPTDPWTHLLLGAWHYNQDDFPSAIEQYEHAALLMLGISVPYWCLANAYEKQGLTELADAHYRKAVEVAPACKSACRKLREWQERVCEVSI